MQEFFDSPPKPHCKICYYYLIEKDGGAHLAVCCRYPKVWAKDRWRFPIAGEPCGEYKREGS